MSENTEKNDATMPPMLKVTDWISKLPNPKTSNLEVSKSFSKPVNPKPANPNLKAENRNLKSANTNPKLANPKPKPANPNPKPGTSEPNASSTKPVLRQNQKPVTQPGPSAQFKKGRAAQILMESQKENFEPLKANLEPRKENLEPGKENLKKPVHRKLFKDITMTMQDIEDMLDDESTPTRKKK